MNQGGGCEGQGWDMYGYRHVYIIVTIIKRGGRGYELGEAIRGRMCNAC
jgi:hypothetical protein